MAQGLTSIDSIVRYSKIPLCIRVMHYFDYFTLYLAVILSICISPFSSKIYSTIQYADIYQFRKISITLSVAHDILSDVPRNSVSYFQRQLYYTYYIWSPRRTSLIKCIIIHLIKCLVVRNVFIYPLTIYSSTSEQTPFLIIYI